MRVRIAIPESHVSPGIIDAGLETTTRINEQLIRSGQVPTFDDALKRGLVKWKPEPPGDEHFDHAGIVVARGWGDCDDLAPWKAASDRVTGEDPGAVARVYPSGPMTWHAIEQRSNGAIVDPSRAAGMGSRVSGPEGISPAVTAPMYAQQQTCVGVQPTRRGWVARADLPWSRPEMPWWIPGYAFSATAYGPDMRSALHNAVMGACIVGWNAGMASGRDLAKLFVTDALAQGVHPGRVLDGMRRVGMDLDAPSWNRAAVVGAMLCGRRGGRCAASV